MLNSTLEDLDTMAYVGDVHGFQAILKSLGQQSLTDEQAIELMKASLRGDHPYQAAIFAELRQACASADLPVPDASNSRRVSPAQRELVAMLDHERRAAAPFLIQSVNTKPAIRHSYFGGLPYALPGESWPAYENVPMTFVCHLWLEDVESRPAAAQKIAVLSLYMHTEEPPGIENNEGWHMRSYTLEECRLLQPLAPPTDDDLLPGCWAVDWQPRLSELPSSDDVEINPEHLARLSAAHTAWLEGQPGLDTNDDSCANDALLQALHPHRGVASCKLFGHPYSLQDNVRADDGFFLVLQLVPIARVGLKFFESGFAYFGVQKDKDGTQKWVCYFEYY